MKRHIPNIITMVRCLLIIPIMLFLLHEYYHMAFYLFIMAGISDGIDGYLARTYGWHSRFGSIADPLVDKLFIVSTLVALTYIGQIPLWLLIVVVSRDILLISAVAFDYFRGDYYDIKPTIISKINTVMQVLFVITIMASMGPYMLSDWIKHCFMIMMCATTVFSMLDYSIQWFGRGHHGLPSSQ